MTPPLPEGARLALLHWPWGTPTGSQIVEAAGGVTAGKTMEMTMFDVIAPLLVAGFVEGVDQYHGADTLFRLTRAGRRALDEIQSGEKCDGAS